MIYYIGNPTLVKGENYQVSTIESCLEYFSNHSSIAVDTETQGRDPHSKKIISIQLGDYDNQYVIDCRFTDILLLKELLESKVLLLHNAKFDYKFLKSSGITIEYIYDTMLAECVLYCGYEKYGYGLADLCKRYLDVFLDKSTRGEFYKIQDNEFTEKQIQYAALDVKYLHKIRELQEVKIKEYNLEYCVNLENNAVKALADIEYNGIILNQDKWRQIALNSEESLKELEKKLDEIVSTDSKLSQVYKPSGVLNLFDYEERQYDINYASPLQIKNICKVLGFNVDSTNDRELTKLASKHDFFKVLQEYREKSKVISTYGLGFFKYINNTTKKIHTDFWQVLNTGRVSSGSKEMNSPNMQNIPASNQYRNCFEARPGYLWVSIDYSGAELRIMADGSNEQGFIDVLNKGEDLHCYVGSMLTGRTITKKDKEERSRAKNINFMKPYGGGPNKLADMAQISIEEAEQIFDKYAKAFPNLNNWLRSQGEFAKKNMYSKTFSPCNRRRWYPDILEARELRKTAQKGDRETWKRILTIEGQTERNGMNSPIQGTNADFTKEALVEIRELINTKYRDKAYLLCTVHDAIDVEVQEDLAKQFSEEMAEIMISAGNRYVNKVRMDVDVTISKEWMK